MMKKIVMYVMLMSSVAMTGLAVAQQGNPDQTKVHREWWDERYPGFPPNKNQTLPLVRVEGNRFVNSLGNTVLFKGLSIADPTKILGEGHWNKNLFIEVKKLGAMIVRIPIHPVAWRGETPAKYLKLLDQAVDWCTEESLYVDIDWHSIGNLEEGLYQDPMYKTSLEETYNFWRTIAMHFTGNNTVAFSELFNEPTDFRGMLGNVSWDRWKTINENLIKLIRAYDNKSIPLVAGFDWAYDLTPLQYAPIDAQGIGYVVHPYPHKRTPPYVPKWEENFGFAADKYPVVATELGFTLSDREANLEYGRAIMEYFEKKHISWIWWVFDPNWGPPMFKSWKTFDLTFGGKFFEEAIQNKIPVQDSTAVH
jgi:endoglucanase